MELIIVGRPFGALGANSKTLVSFRVVDLPGFAEKTFGIASLMFFVVVLVGRTKQFNRVAFSSRGDVL